MEKAALSCPSRGAGRHMRILFTKLNKKMKFKKIMLGTVVLAILLAVGVVATASAYQGDYSKPGPNYSSERHAAMEEAMENTDYQAWSELMSGRGRVTEVITEENFAKFVEAHQLAQAGDRDGADEIRKELGLRTRDGSRMGVGYGQRKSMGAGGRGMNNGDCACNIVK